ncbi:MAG TPA: YggT family protein [Gemmatimonadales bacterium]|nr:YggT family protein [Gemmatimonadales bacterium]
MAYDERLAADEARRAAQHEAVKAEVQADVDSELTAKASRPSPGEAAHVDRAASEIRDHAVKEVVGSERELRRTRKAARGVQWIDYLFGIVYALLGLRFVLGMIGARSGAGFVQFVHTVTDPLYAPFRAMVATPEAPGGYRFEWSILIALVVYALLHLGIKGLLRVLATRRTEI